MEQNPQGITGLPPGYPDGGPEAMYIGENSHDASGTKKIRKDMRRFFIFQPPIGKGWIRTKILNG
jgi:hypothetical protein